MRFTAAAVVLAGSVMAGTEAPISTDFVTQHVTISKCPETVTDCPLESMTTEVATSVVPMTTSTAYTTVVHTVTSCGPEVVDCPAHSTVVSTETVAVSTTVCPVVPTSVPGPWTNTTMPGGDNNGGNQCPGGPNCPGGDNGNTNMPPPATTEAPSCPTHSVTAITKSYTTVLTSVEYSTIAIPCPTGGNGDNGNECPGGPNCPAPTGDNGNGNECPGGPNCPAPTGGMGGNNTCPGGAGCPPPPVTGGAASFAGSAAFAAVAGVAAFVLA